LHERFGIRPKLVPLPIAADPNDTDSDAVLVIGDRAMHPHRFQNFLENWDLGSEWFSETGLPFVFAMWVGRESIASLPLASQLETARDEGVQMIHELSEKYAARYELTIAECVEYLSSNLRFTMNDDEVLGLRTFYRMAVDLELIPRSPVPNWPIVSLCTSPQLTSI
jgi:chorismate dehydratase